MLRSVNAGPGSGVVGSGSLASGSVMGFFGPVRNIASGTVGVFDFGSGAVVAGTVGSGAIVSGNIASGQVGNFAIASGQVHGQAGGNAFNIASGSVASLDIGSGAIVSGRIASGQVGNFHIASGQVQGQAGGGTPNIASGTVNTFDIGSGAIVSGRIASGQVGNFAISSGAVTSGRLGVTGVPNGTLFLRDDFSWQATAGGSVTSGSLGQNVDASGVVARLVADIVSGYNPTTSGMTEESISGMRAVAISPSGNIRIAMASVSGRMPAVGVVFDNVASGIQVNVWQIGLFTPTSGMIDLSGYGGQLLYVGRSGQIVTSSGSFNSGGLLSGDIVQPVGYAQQAFSGVGNPQVINLGVAAMLPFVPGQVYSGDISSGAVGWPHIASGNLIGSQVASGGWESGSIASGAVTGGPGGGFLVIASGNVGTFEIGSGAVVSGRVASGQIGNFHVSSGAITSGRLGVTGNNPNGTFFLRDDFTWQAPSAVITSGGVIQIDFASGVAASLVAPIISGLSPLPVVTAERISGARAVCYNASGQLQIAMASLFSGWTNSGGPRMPAVGVVVDNVESGIQVNMYTAGVFAWAASGNVDYSGYVGREVYVGRSGQLVTSSGSFNSGGILSGDVIQQIGVAAFSGALLVEVNNARVSGNPLIIGSGFIGSAVVSGVPLSGSVTGGPGGGFLVIASGNVGTFEIGSGAVVSGRVASGQIGNFAIASGQVQGQAGAGTPNIASGTVNSFDIGSGAIVSGRVASGQIGNFHVASGQIQGQAGGGTPNIASGTVNTFDIGSGAIVSGRIASGQVGNFHISSGSVTSGRLGVTNNPTGFLFLRDDFTWSNIASGNIASGSIGSYQLASGDFITESLYAALFVSGALQATSGVTAERISGVRAVCFNASGQLQIAMASLFSGWTNSGGPRMPAIGIVADNVESGIRVNVYMAGLFSWSASGNVDFSGYVGQGLFVGRSGHIVTSSGSFNSGGILSGDVLQPIGVAAFSGAAAISVGEPYLSGNPLIIGSGQLRSGSVTGQAGGFFSIASGTITTNDIGSGAIVSGLIASGQVGNFAIASGQVHGQAGGDAFNIASGSINTFDIGSGAIVSGRVASGQIGNTAIASGQVQGQAGTLATFNIFSGSIGSLDIGSGAIVSGRIASGQVGNFHVASGQIHGQAGGDAFNIASGSINTFDIGSGAIVSGRIASGQVGNFHISSGAVTSGRLGVTNNPNGTLFLRDDFTWSTPAGGGITSGGVVQIDMASGVAATLVAPIMSGLSPLPVVTAERISGARAVCYNASGQLQIAMASLFSGWTNSGGPRMPAIGVVTDNVESGIQVNVYTNGVFAWAVSGNVDYSGYVGREVYVGRSGQLVTASGSFNSGGLLSGDVVQRIGEAAFSGAIFVQVAAPYVSGNPLIVGSGQFRSGSVTGQAGGFFTIASGTITTNDIGSGAIVSGLIASGQVGNFAIASGQVHGQAGGDAFNIASGSINTFDIGSGAIVSGRIASGQVGNFHVASGQIHGQAGGDAFNIASGSINTFDIGSGAIVSGRIASGQVGNTAVASGQIQGQAGALQTFNIASGSIGSLDIGSGAIVSGRIASGQIGTLHLTSGAVIQDSLMSTLYASGILQATSGVTAERISGCRAVCFNASGQLQIAMASLFSGWTNSGGPRMPAVGVVIDNVESGIRVNVYMAGLVSFAVSGNVDFSGYVGAGLFVGRSGQVVTASGSFNSGGILSGDVLQPIGVAAFSGAFALSVGEPYLSGNPLIVGSGQFRSGAVTGQAGGFFAIASGTITTNDIGSGAIVSGLIASGQVGNSHIGSGGVQGRLGTVTLNIASGTIGQSDLASGGVQSGHITSGNVCTFSRVVVEDTLTAGETISGPGMCVCLLSGNTLGFAQAGSNLRAPSFGIVPSGAYLSGTANVVVILAGKFLTGYASGWSGIQGQPVYLGSGGFIVPSGGITSGFRVQRIGIAVSGGLIVQPQYSQPGSGSPFGNF